jgi:hypothetical protein
MEIEILSSRLMSSEVEGETGIHFWDKGWQLVRLVKN